VKAGDRTRVGLSPGSAGTPGLSALLGGIALLLLLGLLLGHYGERADLQRLFDLCVSEAAAQWMLAALILVGAAAVLASRRGGQLAAVFLTAVREIGRGGSLWIAVAVAVGLAAGAPFLDAEGGAAGRVKMIASLTSAVAAMIGTLLAVVLPALSFSREMETRSIYVTATKPTPRWVIFGGKLAAVAAALAAALIPVGCGAFVAGYLSVRGEAAAAEVEGRNPEHVWLSAYYSRRDSRPRLERRADGSLPRPEVFYVGRRRDYELAVPEQEVGRKWLVLRIHAGPANPMLQTAPARLTCGGRTHRVEVDRSRPVDLVVSASAARDGRLKVGLEPVLDEEGINRGLRSDPRGTLSIAVQGSGLGVTLAKMLAMIWLQLVLVAAVTLTAASALSFPVAVVTGAATALTGNLSGLAVGILRNALAAGRQAASAGHGHGPGSAHDLAGVEEVSALGQLVRQQAAGMLSLLPDFEAASTSEFLAAGEYVPWRFLAAGVVALLVFRTFPVALLGCLVFSRREVGS